MCSIFASESSRLEDERLSILQQLLVVVILVNEALAGAVVEGRYIRGRGTWVIFFLSFQLWRTPEISR